METAVQKGKRPVPLEVREFVPEDYPALVELNNLVEPDYPSTVEETRYEDEHLDRSTYYFRRYVATSPKFDGLVASVEYQHTPWSFHPERYGIWAGVRPEAQGQGIAGALYEKVLGELRGRGAIALRAWTREDRKDGVGFLARRGFKELERTWESRLDLTTFDPSRFADRATFPEGIEVSTLKEEMDRSPDAIRRLYELNNVLSPDVPRADPYTSPTFEMFRDMVLGPWATTEATFLASDGGRWIGLSSLHRSEADPDVLHTGFTATRREYRGKGIAWALKLRALGWAKAGPFREVRTWNSTLNAPMLAINVSLGFVKQPAWISLGKDLREGSP